MSCRFRDRRKAVDVAFADQGDGFAQGECLEHLLPDAKTLFPIGETKYENFIATTENRNVHRHPELVSHLVETAVFGNRHGMTEWAEHDDAGSHQFCGSPTSGTETMLTNCRIGMRIGARKKDHNAECVERFVWKKYVPVQWKRVPREFRYR